MLTFSAWKERKFNSFKICVLKRRAGVHEHDGFGAPGPSSLEAGSDVTVSPFPLCLSGREYSPAVTLSLVLLHVVSGRRALIQRTPECHICSNVLWERVSWTIYEYFYQIHSHPHTLTCSFKMLTAF